MQSDASALRGLNLLAECTHTTARRPDEASGQPREASAAVGPESSASSSVQRIIVGLWERDRRGRILCAPLTSRSPALPRKTAARAPAGLPMARFTDDKQPKTPTAPRPDNFRTYLAVRRSRFVPREAPLRDASNSPVSSPARAAAHRDAADAAASAARRRRSPPRRRLEERGAAARVLRRPRADAGGGLAGRVAEQLAGGGVHRVPTCRPSTPSACRCSSPSRRPARDAVAGARAGARAAVARGGAPPVAEGHGADAPPSPVVDGRRPAAAEGPPSKKSGGASSLFARLAQDRAPPPQPGRRKKALVGGARFAAGAAPSNMRGVVSARLRCTKCAHDVSRFPGYRWRPTAAYLHFRNYHPDPARLLEEAEAADGHAAYCCQCAWLDAVELRDLGCDHAWVGY